MFFFLQSMYQKDFNLKTACKYVCLLHHQPDNVQTHVMSSLGGDLKDKIT